MGRRVRDEGASKRRPVMDRIEGEPVPPATFLPRKRQGSSRRDHFLSKQARREPTLRLRAARRSGASATSMLYFRVAWRAGSVSDRWGLKRLTLEAPPVADAPG